MRTKQQIFDVVAAHLLTQRKLSLVSREGFEGCAYRGADGTKCAIGALIPDEMYHSDIEGMEVQHLPADVRAAIGADDDDMLEFLRELQKVHDERAVTFWRKALNSVAADWTLNPV